MISEKVDLEEAHKQKCEELNSLQSTVSEKTQSETALGLSPSDYVSAGGDSVALKSAYNGTGDD